MTKEEIQERIKIIEEAKYNGVKRIEVGEDTIYFRDIKDYDTLLYQLREKLNEVENCPPRATSFGQKGIWY